MLQYPGIVSVTASQSIPGRLRSGQAIHLEDTDAKGSILINQNRIQDDYVKTYGMEIIRGRDFKKELSTDNSYVIERIYQMCIVSQYYRMARCLFCHE